MSCFRRMLRTFVAGVLLAPAAALAQFPSALVGFNGPPIDDPATSQEMFRSPQVSGSTAQFIVANTSGFNNNSAFRAASGFQTEGAAAMQVTFRWVDSSDPNAWVRLTTLSGAERPNPSLHLGGKVRMKIVNESEFFAGTVGICLGIRETGVDVPQLADGGVSGDIEWVGATGVRTKDGLPVAPIPAVTISPSPAPWILEWDLSTGIVTRNGIPQGGGIQGFTGDGVLSAPNNRGVLEHIAITNLSGDSATTIILHIDELQFEAPVSDPVTPPTIVAPMLNGDTHIFLTNLISTVNQVQVFRDDTLIITQAVSDPNNILPLALPAPAVTGEVYKARQRDSVTGNTSVDSQPVTVFAEPSPYGISVLIDEDGDGGCALGWEFVGVTNVTTVGTSLYPEGQALFADNSQWQVVDIPLDDPGLVRAWLGGNGSLDPSPSGFYTMDSIWLNVLSSVGPHEMYLDAIQLLDGGGNVMQTVHDFEDGIRYMSQIRGQSNTTFSFSNLSTATSFDGQASHRITWTYADTDQKALGLLTRIATTCGTSVQFPDTGSTLRFHVLVRKESDPGLPAAPTVVGPIVGNQSSVRVQNSTSATAVQLYINGLPVGSPVNPGGSGQVDFGSLTLNVGDSVSAKQTIGGDESDFALPRVVSDKPPAPTVVPPVFPGATSMLVADLIQTPFAEAEFAQIYVNGVISGSVPVPAAQTSVTVTLFTGPVAQGDSITATSFQNGVESDFSAPVIVGVPGPVIHRAPTEGDTSVRVIGINPGASLVRVEVSDTSVFTIDPAGQTSVDVPVSGLDAGETVVASFVLDGNDSAPSLPETVTVATSTPILCDGFEYDETTYLATWQDSAAPRPTLSSDRNTTSGGSNSLLGALTGHRVQRGLGTTIEPTALEPMIWNVNIYDPVGAGVNGDNWAQVIETTADFFLLHIGLSSFFLGSGADLNYYQARINGNGGPDWFNLDEHEAPTRSVGWHVFTMVHKGDFLDIYVDGLLAKKNIPLNAPTTFSGTTGLARIGPGFTAPAAGSGGYYDDYCIEVGAVRFNDIGDQPPSPPRVAAPIEDGDTSVTVAGVDADVTQVRVLDAGLNVLGTTGGPAPGFDTVTVTLNRSLIGLERITADATNANGMTTGEALEVGTGNGAVLVSLGIRETGDAGPLGSVGGTTGAIEWIGASGTVSGAPQGKTLNPSNSWQTVIFNPSTDPITGFTGDGVIDGTRGVLEHLAVTVNAGSSDRSAGLYEIYIDNVVNVGAGAGGSDFVIEDFESNAADDEVLFQEPTFSGTTDNNLAPLPSFSGVSTSQGNPGNSAQLVWYFKDTDANRWVRITTSGTPFRSRPVIDLTQPIRMDILIRESDNPCFPGDTNNDGKIDLTDLINVLGDFGCTGGGCIGDANGDGDTNLSDLVLVLGGFGCGS